MNQFPGYAKSFGGLRALDHIDLDLSSEMKCSSIIGPNGSGKTTLFNTDYGSLSGRFGHGLLRR